MSTQFFSSIFDAIFTTLRLRMYRSRRTLRLFINALSQQYLQISVLYLSLDVCVSVLRNFTVTFPKHRCNSLFRCTKS